MVALLIQHHSNVNAKSKNGLTPMHLCAQNDRVNVASILAKNNADISPQTKEGYTPLHAAAHFGQINMVRFLLKNGANVNKVNCVSVEFKSLYSFLESLNFVLIIINVISC